MPRSFILHPSGVRRSSTSSGIRRSAPSSEAMLAKAIAATAELCGHAISDAAAALLASDLSAFPQPAVLAALSRCRAELQGALNIGEILARIDDGRPSSEEAWDMMPADEAASVVWTREMAQAWVAASSQLKKGDMAGARRSFEERYTQAVLIARCKREKVKWTPSLGTDPVHREQVLREAVQKERLPASYVEELLPYRSLTPQARHLLTQVHLKNLP